MAKIIKVNGGWLPEPEGDLKVEAKKVKSENTTEAGTTVVNVTRDTKLMISGSWRLSAVWVEQFRAFRRANTVVVGIYYPSPKELTEYECQFELTETHVTKAREQMAESGGLYKVEVKITEL